MLLQLLMPVWATPPPRLMSVASEGAVHVPAGEHPLKHEDSDCELGENLDFVRPEDADVQ